MGRIRLRGRFPLLSWSSVWFPLHLPRVHCLLFFRTTIRPTLSFKSVLQFWTVFIRNSICHSIFTQSLDRPSNTISTKIRTILIVLLLNCHINLSSKYPFSSTNKLTRKLTVSKVDPQLSLRGSVHFWGRNHILKSNTSILRAMTSPQSTSWFVEKPASSFPNTEMRLTLISVLASTSVLLIS